MVEMAVGENDEGNGNLFFGKKTEDGIGIVARVDEKADSPRLDSVDIFANGSYAQALDARSHSFGSFSWGWSERFLAGLISIVLPLNAAPSDAWMIFSAWISGTSMKE